MDSLTSNKINKSTNPTKKKKTVAINKDPNMSLKNLKYSMDDNEIKLRMSKKQRRLQYGESTLGSFMTYDEKMSIITAGKHKPKEVSTISNINNANKKVYVPRDLRILGKKRKRVSRMKKAIYLSRLKKSNYLLEKILKISTKDEIAEEAEAEIRAEEDEIKEAKESTEIKELKEITESTTYPELSKHVKFPENNEVTNKDLLSTDGFSNLPKNFFIKYESNPVYKYNTTNTNLQQYPIKFNHFINHEPMKYDYYLQNQNQQTVLSEADRLEMKKLKKREKNKMYRQRKKEQKQAEKTSVTPNIENSIKDQADNKFLFEDIESSKVKTLSSNDGIKETLSRIVKYQNFTKEDLNDYLKQNKKVEKLNIKSLLKVTDESTISSYVKKFEGITPIENIENGKTQLVTKQLNKMVREYVDQELDNEVDTKISNFIIKLRDIYFRKKEKEPLKAKKRFVVGIREVEKYLKLEYVKCVFIVPNIEKMCSEDDFSLINEHKGDVDFSVIQETNKENDDDSELLEEAKIINNIKSSKEFKKTNLKSTNLDDRLFDIISLCRKDNIPYYYCLNKFKLGKACRKKNSTVSMMAIVNVEGLEREFKSLISDCALMRERFYAKNNGNKHVLANNRFIDFKAFEQYDVKSNNINEDEEKVKEDQ